MCTKINGVNQNELNKCPTLQRFNDKIDVGGKRLVCIGLARFSAALIEIAVQPQTEFSIPSTNA